MNQRRLRADEKLKQEKDDDFMEYDGSIYVVNKQRIGREGEFPFKCHFISDSYMGFDEEHDFSIKTLADPDVKEFNYCKEDKRAVEGASGIQALFAEEEGDDPSSHDEDGSDAEELSATDKLKLRLQQAGLENALDKRDGSTVLRPQDKKKDPRLPLNPTKWWMMMVTKPGLTRNEER